MVAICFYTFDSYIELKEGAEDKDALCDTYSDWLVEFTKAVKTLKEKGLDVVPVNVNIDELKKWCKRNKLKNTSSARSKFALELGRSRS
jgi:hypothetical protein